MPSLPRSTGLCFLALAGLVACASGVDEDLGDDPYVDPQLADSITGHWVLPADVMAIGNSLTVTQNTAPSWNGGRNCSENFTEGAQTLGDFLKREFPGVSSYGGYACRQNTANSAKTSMHGTGRAIDVFIPVKGKNTANPELGDPVANWLVTHAEEIGVQYIIWHRTQWSGYRKAPKARDYTGPHPHHDHLHVELNVAGSQQKTSWFINGGPSRGVDDTTGGSTDDTDDTDDADDTDGTDDGVDDPGDMWIGSQCDDALDCVFTANGQPATCMSWHDAEADRLFGLCSVACQGSCPTRAGHAPSYCVKTSASGGECVPIAASQNDNCLDLWATEPRVVARYVGSGQVSATDVQTVCARPDTRGVACSGRAGECINTDQMTCGTATLTGLCPGSSNIRCCPE